MSTDENDDCEADAREANAREQERSLIRRESTQLQPRSKHSSELPDAYERKYMSKGGRLRASHRMVSGWKFNSLMGGTAAYVAATGLAAGSATAVVLPLAIIGAIWLGLSVLRVTVTDRAVNIQYATFGPSIPLESIICVRAIDYKAMRHGGWGFRRREGGPLYNMPGDGGRAVEIQWRNAKGEAAIVTVGIKTASEVAANIQAAMDALDSSAGVPALDETSPKLLDDGV